MHTIELFGRTYAPNARRVVDSLFKPGRTDNGTYRLVNGGALLSDLTGEPRAYVHPRGFVVTAHKSNGRTRYMFGLSSTDATFINSPDSYVAQCDGCVALIARFAK